MFSNTFAGIAPASVPAYIVAQALGGAFAVLVLRTLYPDVTPEDAATVLVLHQDDGHADDILVGSSPSDAGRR